MCMCMYMCTYTSVFYLSLNLMTHLLSFLARTLHFFFCFFTYLPSFFWRFIFSICVCSILSVSILLKLSSLNQVNYDLKYVVKYFCTPPLMHQFIPPSTLIAFTIKWLLPPHILPRTCSLPYLQKLERHSTIRGFWKTFKSKINDWIGNYLEESPTQSRWLTVQCIPYTVNTLSV